MTVALTLKVNDGVILASDSASTLRSSDNPNAAMNIYNNANKIFNLKKGLPLGAATWGQGGIGGSSIETLVKDFRKMIREEEIELGNTYTVRDVAEKFREYFEDIYTDSQEKSPLGFYIVGYGSDSQHASEFIVEFGEEERNFQRLREPDESGISFGGQTEPIHRLLLGISTSSADVLINSLKMNEQQAKAVLNVLSSEQAAPVVHAAMPIQDAIDLAEFLVEMTIKFMRFTPQAPTVGGPVEIAAITKHEQFKWVERKHYFSQELNPHDFPVSSRGNDEIGGGETSE